MSAEFRANDDEVETDEEIVLAQWVCQVESATFEKPEKYLHLKALYLKGFIDGKPLTKMLVNGGAVVNLMSYSTFIKGAIRVELIVGSKTLPTTFFVVDGKGTYSLLLGRDWIHANCCIPSTMN